MSHRDYFIMGSRYVRRVCAISIAFVVTNKNSSMFQFWLLLKDLDKSSKWVTIDHLEKREVKQLKAYVCTCGVTSMFTGTHTLSWVCNSCTRKSLCKQLMTGIQPSSTSLCKPSYFDSGKKVQMLEPKSVYALTHVSTPVSQNFRNRLILSTF